MGRASINIPHFNHLCSLRWETSSTNEHFVYIHILYSMLGTECLRGQFPLFSASAIRAHFPPSHSRIAVRNENILFVIIVKHISYPTDMHEIWKSEMIEVVTYGVWVYAVIIGKKIFWIPPYCCNVFFFSAISANDLRLPRGNPHTCIISVILMSDANFVKKSIFFKCAYIREKRETRTIYNNSRKVLLLKKIDSIAKLILLIRIPEIMHVCGFPPGSFN